MDSLLHRVHELLHGERFVKHGAAGGLGVMAHEGVAGHHDHGDVAGDGVVVQRLSRFESQSVGKDDVAQDRSNG